MSNNKEEIKKYLETESTSDLKSILKLLKRIHTTTFYPIKINNVTESNKLKLRLVNDLYFLIHQSIESILNLQKKRINSVVPIIARTIFENMVNLAIIITEDERNGAFRFFVYSEMSNYKLYKNYRQLDPDIADRLFTKEELKTGKTAEEYFSKNNLPARDWFGKNLFASCQYLDKHKTKVINIPNFFVLSYLQTYPFLSKSVHGMATHLDNVSIQRGRWPFKKFVLWNQSGIHDASYLYHTIISYLCILCYYFSFLEDQERYKYYHSILLEKFGIISNSLNMRQTIIDRSELK